MNKARVRFDEVSVRDHASRIRKVAKMPWEISIQQTGLDQFTVRYGAEKWQGDYASMAAKLGQSLMHSLCCEWLLDNRRKGEQ